MKKILAIWLFAATLAVSCTDGAGKDTPDPSKPDPAHPTDPTNPGDNSGEDGPDVFEATFGEAVKSTLDGTKVLWEVDDEVSIMWEGGSVTAKSPVAGVKTTFTAEVGEAEAYYAVYPASLGATLQGETISLSIPALQHGGFAEANIAVSRSKAKANTFLFRNLCALVSFTLSRDDIAEVTVSPNAGGVLAGDVSITLATTGIPNVDASKAAASDIVLTPSGGEAFAPGTYYFCTMKGSVPDGISFSFKTSSGEALANKTSFPSAEFERSGLLAFGTIDDNAVGPGPGPGPDPGETELKLRFDFAIGEAARAREEFNEWPLARLDKPFDPGFAYTVTPSYPIDGVNYTFELITPGCDEQQPNKTRFSWSSAGVRFIVFQYGLGGLPAVEGYKLTKVTITHGMTTTAKVVITKIIDHTAPASTPASSDIVKGGEVQAFSKTVAVYNYDLEETEANTRYYLYTMNSQAIGIDQLDLVYTKVGQ